MDLVKEAIFLGFSGAAVMDTTQLVFVPEYRMFCEENLCGCYNVNPACPPESGTVEEMKQRALQYEKTLVLQTMQEDAHDPVTVQERQAYAEQNDRRTCRKNESRWQNGCPDHERRTVQTQLLYVGILRRCTENGRGSRDAVLDR